MRRHLKHVAEFTRAHLQRQDDVDNAVYRAVCVYCQMASLPQPEFDVEWLPEVRDSLYLDLGDVFGVDEYDWYPWLDGKPAWQDRLAGILNGFIRRHGIQDYADGFVDWARGPLKMTAGVLNEDTPWVSVHLFGQRVFYFETAGSSNE